MIKYECDSRKVKPGQTFVAFKGNTVDGHDFIKDAIKNGATSVICKQKIDEDIPYMIVDNPEEYLKEKLKEEYSKDLQDLSLIGVTGTNGKTTTCYLTYQMLNLAGIKTAYIGTIGFYYGDEKITLENTTPDNLTIYNLLYHAKELGCTHVVMEVSSHSLCFNRLNGLKLSMGAFTNLTEDHLNYHKTMENYLNAKLMILDLLKEDSLFIVNTEDKSSNSFINKWKNTKSIGLNGDYKINSFSTDLVQTNLNFSFENKSYEITTPLTSKFNVYNYLTALAIVNNLGVDINTILDNTSKIKASRGRCETYKINNGIAVIDYAHTPDALEKVITAYNELKKNKVITITGCGGNRDASKRPIMGDIATNLSDYVIFTNDNPRTEKAEDIMNDITKDLKKKNYEIIFDRREAIKKGIDMMEKNDILLILGKGHEDYQIIGHTKYHLDDVEEVLKWSK